MKNFIKISLTFLTIFVIFPITSLAKDQILPLPKPNVSEEIKKTTEKKKNIYPKEKPKTKSKNEDIQISNEDIQIQDSEKEEAFIYPKKKTYFSSKKS